MPKIKGNEIKFNGYVPDSMTTEESNTKARKKSLQDKINRAPELNKGIAQGKTKRNYTFEI